MKRITTMFILVVIFMLIVSMNAICGNEKDLRIESLDGEENNPWESRPLIQTTTYEDEYLDAVRLSVFEMPIYDKTDSQTLYDETSRCVVRVVMGQYAGSGLIWRMEEKGMVIASNKHLLCEAAYGTVTFINGTSITAEVMAYSQKYDIGFLFVPRENLTWEILRDCYEVRMLGNTQNWIDEYKERKARIMQVASSQQAAQDRYEGVLVKMTYVPEFQNEMLETVCYSKAGMSGGGVFNENGYLIGMIAGGDVGGYDSVRESETTYSVPVWDIEAEYEKSSG